MTPKELEVFNSMFLNPRAPVVSVSLDKIEDPATREAIRNLLRTIELVYGGVAQASNFNLAKLVAQPDQPTIAEGESIVWHDTDAPLNTPMAFILTKINGQTFRFPTDQLQGTIPPPPEPTLPTLASLQPASVTLQQGQSATLTVTLTAAAPVGGSLVTFVSSNPTAATVSPAEITIAQGVLTGTVTVTGAGEGASGISASYNNSTKSTTVTVQASVPVPPPSTGYDYLHTFEQIAKVVEQNMNVLRLDQGVGSTDLQYAYQIQAKATDRVTQVLSPSRHGSKAISLKTNGDDTNVSGSGTAERCDLNPMWSEEADQSEHWYAVSIYIPPGFIFAPPAADFYRVHLTHQFHDMSGRPPYPTHIIVHHLGSSLPTFPTWRVTIEGGDPKVEQMRALLRNQERIVADTWWDFVHHIKWSTGTNGFIRTWLRKNNEPIGGLEVDYHGPTKGPVNVKMKLSNYHTYAPGPGNITELIFDRVMRGPTAASVSMFQLEGEPQF